MNKLPNKVLHNRFVEIQAPTEGINGKPGHYRDLKMAIELRVWQKKLAARKKFREINEALNAAKETSVLEGAML